MISPTFRLVSTAQTVVLVGFLVLDMYLYFVVTSNPRGTTLPLSTNNTDNPCFNSPYCLINVKSLLLDPPNFYVHNTMSSIVNRKFQQFEYFEVISVNAMSMAHVGIALVASKLISQDSLCVRRVGVVLFEVRNFLDALDGLVARSRRGQLQYKAEAEAAKGVEDTAEQKEAAASAETLGFWLDGICDALGCLFLYTACFFYLQRHPVKRSLFSYNPLPMILMTSRSKSKDSGSADGDADFSTKYGIFKCSSSSSSSGVYSGTQSNRYIVKHIIRSVQRSGLMAISFGFQTLFGSIAWNRCIASFTRILEVPNPAGRLSQGARSDKLLHSPLFWFIIFIWRYSNPHAWLEGLLVAIFFNKMGEFLSFFRYFGFIVIFTAIFLTEIYIYDTSQVI